MARFTPCNHADKVRSVLTPRFIWVILSTLAVVLAFMTGGPPPFVHTPPATHQRQAQSYIAGDFSRAGLWTTTRVLTAQENAAAHFARHGQDLDAQNIGDYIAQATAFLHTPPDGTQTKQQADGDIVRFHAPSARFGVMRADGTPRTYFRLRPNRHGNADNQTYFDQQ